MSSRAKLRGYRPRLTEALIEELAGYFREGLTASQASALCGVYRQLVEKWMNKGKAQIDTGKRSLHTDLVREIERAQAEYHASLIRSGNKAAIDGKRIDGKWIRWRLSLSSHDFRQRDTAQGSDPVFEQVSPDEARARLEEKLALFLARHAEVSTETNAEPSPST